MLLDREVSILVRARVYLDAILPRGHKLSILHFQYVFCVKVLKHHFLSYISVTSISFLECLSLHFGSDSLLLFLTQLMKLIFHHAFGLSWQVPHLLTSFVSDIHAVCRSPFAKIQFLSKHCDGRFDWMCFVCE